MASYLQRTAQARGLLQGSKPWTVLWVLLTVRRVLKRLGGKEPEIVHRTVLRAGEALVVRHGERPADR